MVGKEFEVLEICFFSLVKLVRVGLGSDVFTQSGDFLVLIWHTGLKNPPHPNMSVCVAVI